LLTDPIAICERLVGLDDVRIFGLVDLGASVHVHIETRSPRPGCRVCGVVAVVKDRVTVELVDLPCFGRSARLFWRKRRWCCPEPTCPNGSWTEEAPSISAPRLVITDRAARWATLQVGRWGRSVNEVAHELGCDWHTVNDAVVAYGAALVEDPGRFGDVTALGLDEVLFVRRGARHTQEFTTQLVDVKTSQLLDIVEGRGADEPKRWILARGATWRSKVQFGTLDLSSTYRSAFASVLAHATLIADPFHLVRLANAKVDECRRRVQNEVLGHRGRKSDPLYRCRRLLIKAAERLDERGQEKMLGLLRVGDPRGDVTAAWHAKEAVRELYSHADAQLATEWIEQLIVDMADPTWPVEVRSLGRTLAKWKHEIIAWHVAHFTNGPTEAMNNLIKRVKRVAFGFTSFRNYRIRSLLYAGKPNWDLLATVTPR
jgi:transposase